LQLRQESLFLAVNLLDRYRSVQAVRDKYDQLLGCTVLLIAAKYGDNNKCYVPSMETLIEECEKDYEVGMFIEMEWNVLMVLNWTIGHPDAPAFIQAALADTSYDAEVSDVSSYIAEVALFFREFACTKPSVIAQAALILARYSLGVMPHPCADMSILWISKRLFKRLRHAPDVIVQKYTASHYSNAPAIVSGMLQLPTHKRKRDATEDDELDAARRPHLTSNKLRWRSEDADTSASTTL
jgi:hypothetical protein